MNRRQLGRSLLAAGLIVVFAMLPALIAGTRIEADAAPGEWRRVLAGLHGDDGAARPGSVVARMFYGATLTDRTLPAPDPDSTAGARLLAQARLAQVGGMLALALLAYLVVMQAQSRERALLALAWLAVTAPVLQQGEVLRPETPAAVFGLFALLFLQLLAGHLQSGRRRSPWRRLPVTAAMALIAALATALAIAALPHYSAYLLVPGAAMAAILLQASGRMLRTMRRRQWVAWPVRALAARLWPWVLASLLAIVATVLLLAEGLELPAQDLPPTPSSAGLLPASPWLHWPLAALAALGGLGFVVRAGIGMQQRGWLTAELLLGLHCAVLLLHHGLGGGDIDALPAAVPVAVLLGNGVVFAVLLVAGRVRRGRR